MVPVPKAVRVKTTDGWQDVAMQGPPGPPSGSMQLIQDITLGAAAPTIDFQNIPQKFAHLRLICALSGTNATMSVTALLRLNSDAGNNYNVQRSRVAGATVTGLENISANGVVFDTLAGSAATWKAPSIFELPDYADTVGPQAILFQYGDFTANAPGGFRHHNGVAFWSPSAGVNALTLSPASGQFAAGSRATLYGIKAEPEGMRQNWTDVYCQIVQPNRPTLSVPFNAWTIFPIPAEPTISITKADGVNPDFTRNADGSVTVNKAGNYHINAGIGAGEQLSDGSNINLAICKKAGATPVIGDWLEQANVNVGGTVNQYPAIPLAVDQWCNVGDRIALLVYQYSGGGVAKSFTLGSFAIHRTGAGPPGVGTTPGLQTVTPDKFAPGVGSVQIKRPTGPNTTSPGFTVATEPYMNVSGDLQHAITPSVNVWWEVDFESIIQSMDAVWRSCDADWWLDLGVQKTDALGQAKSTRTRMPGYSSAIGWITIRSRGLFKLAAGGSYIARPVLTPTSGTFIWYQAFDHLFTTSKVVGYW